MLFFLTLSLYLLTCLKDAGAVQSLKLIRSLPVHSTEPQSLDFANNAPLTEMIHQKNKAEKASECHKELEDENSGPISISALGRNASVNDSDEESEPQGRVSIEITPVQDESSIQIETRYCTVCNIEQPLRAKHCRVCNVCVAMYDHHCPWMGNCIGERNRFYFWWYLAAENTILDWSLILLFNGLVSGGSASEWAKTNWMVLIGFVIAAIFAAMVGFLFVFHSYLAAANKTTWEQLSRDKIGYMARWPKHLGSPFSKGVWKNLNYYCCKALPKGYTMWIYPSKIPNT